MDRNEILEKNLLEAGRLLKESKKMITLTYSERTYLQQWFYQKTGNRIMNRACDIEQALIMFYEVNKPEYIIEVPLDDKELKTKIVEDKTTEKQSTTKKSTTAKTKKIEDNETKESEEADDKL
jgi:hypothetical protein